MNYAIIVFLWNSSNHQINSAKLTINDLISKINSAKFIVFEPANHENLCPRKFLSLIHVTYIYANIEAFLIVTELI